MGGKREPKAQPYGSFVLPIILLKRLAKPGFMIYRVDLVPDLRVLRRGPGFDREVDAGTPHRVPGDPGEVADSESTIDFLKC